MWLEIIATSAQHNLYSDRRGIVEIALGREAGTSSSQPLLCIRNTIST
jgi:hypothetical protein